MLKKIITLLILITNFNNNCFDLTNQDLTNALKVKLVISFPSKPQVVSDYTINPNSTSQVGLPANSNKLQVKIFNSTNVPANSQKILLLNIINELLQDFKTSSTARITMKNPNNQVTASILR